MPQIVYPPRYDRKVLSLETPGDPPARVSLVIPTVTRPGDPFEARLCVLDEMGYPAATDGCDVRLLADDHATELARVPFGAGDVPAAAVTGLTLDRTGPFRLAAETGGRLFVSNPTCCTADPSVLPVFWGDPHVHTVLSQCHPDKCRSTDFGYAAGRWVTTCPTDGVSSPASSSRRCAATPMTIRRRS